MPSPSAPPATGRTPLRRAERPRPTLLAPGWRAPALVLGLLAAAAITALSVFFYHRGDTWFDQRTRDWLVAHIPESPGRAIVHVTDPPYAVVVLVIVVVVALVRRRVDLAVLAVAGPALAVVLSSEILKPLLGRRLELMELTHSPYPPNLVGSFPSGHETGVTATAWVVLLACWQLPVHRWIKAAVTVLLTGWVAIAAVALTRNAYHYASDTIGGACVATAVVLLLALVIAIIRDRVPRRRAPAV